MYSKPTMFSMPVKKLRTKYVLAKSKSLAQTADYADTVSTVYYNDLSSALYIQRQYMTDHNIYEVSGTEIIEVQ